MELRIRAECDGGGCVAAAGLDPEKHCPEEVRHSIRWLYRTLLILAVGLVLVSWSFQRSDEQRREQVTHQIQTAVTQACEDRRRLQREFNANTIATREFMLEAAHTRRLTANGSPEDRALNLIAADEYRRWAASMKPVPLSHCAVFTKLG